MSLRGLNIQWPFSRLILAGTKIVEVRDYDINHGNPNVLPDEELWLMVTIGNPTPSTNAIGGCSEMGKRPAKAHTVGTVIFSRSEKYTDIKTLKLGSTA